MMFACPKWVSLTKNVLTLWVCAVPPEVGSVYGDDYPEAAASKRCGSALPERDKH